MTPEEHRILVEVRDATFENQKILKKIQGSNRVSLAFTVLYWVVIVGASFGAYYVIQPYVDAVKGSVQAIENDPTTITEPFTLSGAVKNIQGLKDLLK